MAGLLLKLLPPSILSGGATSTPRWSPRRRPTPTHRPTTRIRSSGSSSATTTPTPTPTPASSTSSTAAVKLTYLEFNGWLWELPGGLRVLVDPILVGNLDFGIPWLFDAAKKTLRNSQSQPDGGLLAGVDLLLITQSLDDHCHLRTLTELAAVRPDLPVVTTPNARPILSALPFADVTYLEPGQSAAAAAGATVLATAGPVLGPPWQRPENGYIVTAAGAAGKSVYYEPHCVYDAGFLRERALRADVLITPVVKQLLPADFTLVSGQEDAVELARLLRPSYVVPMSNGEFDAKGLLAALVSTRGTVQAFRAMLADALPDAKVVEPTPGVPLHLRFDDDDDDDDDNSSSSSSSP